jgi:hypothetical protein
MTQFEQENDLGRGGGEVDDETMDDAWRTAEDRRSTANAEERERDEDERPGAVTEKNPQPWAKFSSGERRD